MTADLTVFVVGDDDARIGRTLRALGAQSELPTLMVIRGWSDVPGVLDAVETGNVAVLAAGVEPSPDWTRSAMEHMADPRTGAVGGRTLLLEAPATASDWFDEARSLARMTPAGGVEDRLTGIPSSHLVRDVLFLRLDTMVVRTEIAKKRHWAGVPYQDLPRDVPTCLLAARLGYRVVYDSALVAVAHVLEEVAGPATSVTWEEAGRAEILTLGWHPRPLSRYGRIALSLVVGTRRSPGFLMGVVYAPWAGRRARWRAILAGKIQGLKAPLR